MRTEIAIAKYTPIFSMPAEVAAVPKAVLGVPGISKRVKKAAERIPLRLRILLQVEVLGGEEISKKKVVREQSYTDISNIRIINMQILYLLNRRSS